MENIISNPLILFLIAAWVLPWKGFALWKAGQRKSKNWFIAILVFNTVGILEILYLFVFSEWKRKNASQKEA